MKYGYNYETCIGKVGIIEEDNFIIGLQFYKVSEDFCIKETVLIKKAFLQLDEYLNGKRKEFNLQLRFCGTDFQCKVWDALKHIPYGELRSYKDIAKKIGNEKAVRAVGNANGKNQLPIFIPCHRVIGADGSIGGYSYGIELKRKLLELEKNSFTKKI